MHPRAVESAYLAALDLETRLSCHFYQYFPDADRVIDGVTIHARSKYAKHLAFFERGATHAQRLFMAANRVGKALRHGTRVATPTGWCAVEDVRVGDVVFAGDGSRTVVTGVYPQGEVDLFSLTIDGHHEVVTCGEHRWWYLPPKARYRTRVSHGRQQPNPAFGRWTVGTTRDLAAFRCASPRQRPVLPCTRPFQGSSDQALPIDPYVLGVLLGDGCLTGRSVKLTSADPEILAEVRRSFDLTHYERYEHGVLRAVSEIRALGLQGRDSFTKFVPESYLYNDASVRLRVLHGLMDTDGSISAVSGAMEYTTCSDQLATDVEWLAVSLGMKVRRVRRHTKAQNGNGRPSWRLLLRSAHVCPFSLPRKVARWRPLRETRDWVVHRVRPVGRGLATCLEVAHPSHTYVIEHGLVTHNSEAGAYEVTCHLTGLYPPWWTGRRFEGPTEWWCCGTTAETTRDIVQAKLFGPPMQGTLVTPGGMIPPHLIHGVPQRKPHGLPDSISAAWVRHVSGGLSHVALKTYEQGRKSFEGTSKSGIWDDEEPPEDVYTEQLYRTATTNGIVIVTFTPLQGMSDVVSGFIKPDGEAAPYKTYVQAGWDDVPHLDEATKAMLLATTPPFQRDARTKGIPQLGAGAIYAFPESALKVPPFPIPSMWKRGYALDAGGGAKPTAAVFAAQDPETFTLYITHVYKRESPEVALHVAALKAHGADWMAGVGDAAALVLTDHDATQLVQAYNAAGLDMILPDKSVETGIMDVWSLMSMAQLKVFSTCEQWFEEWRLYHRDEKGRIVKRDDHLMDATRYLVRSGRARMKLKPMDPSTSHTRARPLGAHGWMAS